MDMRNNKTQLQDTIKRFALKTTASAILSLNVEAALADPCPSYITSGSGLVGVICDFDSTTGSNVTVENGGTVGGINMTSYSPVPPSSIIINEGGVVENAVGTAGIVLDQSELSNGLFNSGTISTTSTGIAITNASTVSGGLSNSGVINTGGIGISINQSQINHGILNSGTINSSNSGIVISNTSTVSGNITNSGTIQASGVFVGIAITGQSTINGNITNSGLIEALGNGNGITMHGSSTLNGGISNSGFIRSAAQSGISVNISSIQNNFSNSGTISGATNGVAIHNASTVGGNISNSGIIDGDGNGLAIYSSTTIAGSIFNSGTISGDTGLLVNFSATVAGGISNSGTIQGNIEAINIAPDSFVNDLNILGQNARIIGAVQAANTTVNIQDGATFTSEGSYEVNIFNIKSNAHFNMANTITATTLNNSGTLATDTLSQTLIGNYTQSTGGLFQMGVSSTSDYGQLAATGAVDLAQSGHIDVQVSQNVSLQNGSVLSNIISGNTLSEPTSSFVVSDNSYMWAFTPFLNNSNTGVNLAVTINPSAYNICQGAYCQGALTAIIGQVAAGNPFFGPYATLPTANALYDAASQATPELTNENIQVIQLITRAVQDVVPMWNTLRGKSSGDAMLYQPGKVWFKPYGASMTQNRWDTIDGFNATAYGAVIGKDLQLTKDVLLGGALAAGKDNMHGKSLLSGQSIDSQAYQGMLYGAKQFPKHIYLAGQGLLGYELNHTNRSIPLYATTAKGSYNAWFTNIRAEAGWSTYALSPNFVITPEVDASYLYVSQERYQETGSPMNLRVGSNNNSSLVLGAYGNGAYHLAALKREEDLTLTGYAGIAGNVINSQPETISTFVAGGSSFSTFGVQFNEVVFRGGAGIMLTNPTKPIMIELNYDLQVGNNAYSGVGSATIKYKI